MDKQIGQKQIGQRITELRKIKGLSQENLAKSRERCKFRFAINLSVFRKRR